MALGPRRAQRLVALVLGTAVALGTATVPAADADPGHAPATATGPAVYVVTLAGRPAAENPLTRPAPGQRFDRTRSVVADLDRRLHAEQDAVLATVGEPEVLYHYTTALNGFAARLDEFQVKRLLGDPRVLAVERSTVSRPAGGTAGSLGLTGPGGAWSRAGGPARAGRGMVVGVVDSGIWPENPSFAGLPQQTPGTSAGLPGFHGACPAGERWSRDDCNDKVVSARWFVAGFGSDRLASTALLSPRDTTGHGSHAASVAAGEANVDVLVDRQHFGRDSGMAPAARIAVYKACWTAPDPADDGCATADTVAAVDRAVADGVDVLSYAVAGSTDPSDTVARAFLGAASAGVFVAAAAGNDGPRVGSVGHDEPWVTTVGASTHLLYQGSVRLGDGQAYPGAMAADHGTGTVPIVLGSHVAAAGASARAARLCEPDSLDAAAVAGRIVVCDRGAVPRVDKSTAVARAGGVGMVLANTSRDTEEADVHAVPTVHLDVRDAARVKAYVRAAGERATAMLDPRARGAQEPAVAPFSGRGPVPGADLLKPDVTAPGVAVLGAVAPPAADGHLWDLRSGTSVSTAHVAGLAAFLRGLHPDWSPARVKSALMTSADRLRGTAGPFVEGSGQVDPAGVLDPGLVLDSGPAGWHRFLTGAQRARDLNLPSLAVGGLVGRATVTRRLTSVAGRTETYTAAVTGLHGVDVRVRPATVTVRPGRSRTVRITLTATRQAPIRDYARGLLTFTGPRHQVSLPLVVRAAAVAAPARVGGTVDEGRVVVDGRSGNGARVRPDRVALAAAHTEGLSLRPGPFDAIHPRADEDTFATTVAVPQGAAATRFEVLGTNAGDDLDLYVYRDGALVRSSDGPGPQATVTLLDPAPGDYSVYVHAAAAGNLAVTTGGLSSWVVGPGAAEQDVSVRTRQDGTRPGDPFRSTVSWEALDPTQRWFGVLRYAGSDRRTLITIG